MKLAIQKYIAQHGLNKAIKDFALDMRENRELILLKYSQIDSDFKHDEVQECRGLILEKGSWKIVSMAFSKFFNAGETHAHPIDWKSAKVLKKLDGSLITLYNYKGEWYTATTGTIDGMAGVNNYEDLTFSKLFWNTVKLNTGMTKEQYVENLVEGYSYMFELCTPYNIVVCPHGESKVHLLSIRDLSTLEEIPHHELHLWNTHIPVVEAIPMSADLEILQAELKDKPFHEEGYVICDEDFNRLKLKNPSYVAAHFLKSSTALHHVLTIIKANEVEEYAATFIERAEEIRMLEKAYYNLMEELQSVWENELNAGIGYTSRKHYAEIVFGAMKEFGLQRFTDFFFTMKDKLELPEKIAKLKEEKADEVAIERMINRLTNFSVESYLENYKERELYEYLSSKINTVE